MNREVYNSIEIIGISDELPTTSNNFKEIKQKKIVSIKKHEIKKILRSIVKIEILHSSVNNSFSGISNEGQKLTNNRLFVEGQIINRIEYISNNIQNSICTQSINSPFYVSIMLDDSFNLYSKFKIIPYIEDIFINQISNTKILQNILFVFAVIDIS